MCKRKVRVVGNLPNPSIRAKDLRDKVLMEDLEERWAGISGVIERKRASSEDAPVP